MVLSQLLGQLLVGSCLFLGLAFAGYWIGEPKDRPLAGALLGALLGPLGLVVTALLPIKRCG